MDKTAADIIGIEAGKLATRYGIADIQRVIGICVATMLFSLRQSPGFPAWERVSS